MLQTCEIVFLICVLVGIRYYIDIIVKLTVLVYLEEPILIAQKA